MNLKLVKSFHFLAFLLVCIITESNCQANVVYQFERAYSKIGESRINALLEDVSSSAIWIGTESGLYVINDKKVVKKVDDQISALYRTWTGSIWASTYEGELLEFYNLNLINRKTIKDKELNAKIICKDFFIRDGFAWLLSRQDRLYMFNLNEEVFERTPSSFNEVTSMLLIKDRILIGSRNGLFLHDENTNILKPLLKKTSIYNIEIIGEEEAIVVGVKKNDNVIVTLDVKDFSINWIEIKNKSLLNEKISFITRNQKNELFLGSKTLFLKNLKYEQSLLSSLGGVYLTDILLKEDNLILLGTDGLGLIIGKPNKRAFFNKVKPNKKVVVNDILFNRNDSTIIDGYSLILEELYQVMNLHKDWSLLIEGHTSKTKTLEAAKRLSDGRANAIKNYLVQKGIDEKRISTKGWGASRLISDLAPIDEKHRRVEFTFLQKL
ncbi:MAG: OmpA family protein [Chitinophagales bacterium]|nr:OmpA family protein [Chitinophagales bacterium]